MASGQNGEATRKENDDPLISQGLKERLSISAPEIFGDTADELVWQAEMLGGNFKRSELIAAVFMSECVSLDAASTYGILRRYRMMTIGGNVVAYGQRRQIGTHVPTIMRDTADKIVYHVEADAGGKTTRSELITAVLYLPVWI